MLLMELHILMELLQQHLKVLWDSQNKPLTICSFPQEYIAYGHLILQTQNRLQNLQDKTCTELIHIILVWRQIKNHGLESLQTLQLHKTGGLQMMILQGMSL